MRGQGNEDPDRNLLALSGLSGIDLPPPDSLALIFPCLFRSMGQAWISRVLLGVLRDGNAEVLLSAFSAPSVFYLFCDGGYCVHRRSREVSSDSNYGDDTVNSTSPVGSEAASESAQLGRVKRTRQD